MALNEEDDCNPEDKRRNKAQRLEPEKAHFTGEFVIAVTFGDHVLHHLASNSF